MEIARLEAVVPALKDKGASLSIDSFSPPVQRWALAQGVDYLNDIHGFADAALYPDLAASSAKLIVMHMVQERGVATRTDIPPAEIFDRVLAFFEERLTALTEAGIAPDRLILDPGMGLFLGTDPENSLILLRRMPELKKRYGLPVLVSVSRKGFLRKLTGRRIEEIGAATLAAELYAEANGADYIRTHAPGPLRDGLKLLKSLGKSALTFRNGFVLKSRLASRTFHDPQIFRHRRHPRPHQHLQADAGNRHEGRHGGRQIFTRGEHRHRVVIGKDTRLSGYMIESALVSGFTAVGMDVFQFGPLPTPAVAMLTRSLRADLGVMITARTIPYEDNGIKFFGPDGQKLSDEVEMEIESLMDAGLEAGLAPARQIGRAKRVDDSQARYIEFAKRTFPRNLRLDGLRIVIDCANGAAYKVAPEVLWELGADIVHHGRDARRHQHQPGLRLAPRPQAMCAKVREVRADFGIALDGDADRVVMADEQGRIIDGDQILALIAKSWSKNDKLKGGGVVGTVMSNAGLDRYLQDAESEAGALGRGRPLCAGRDAQGRLQCRRRTVRPHHPVGFLHHRRRPDRGAAGAGGAGAGRQAGLAKRRICSNRCPRCWRMCASGRARRWKTPRSNPASRTAKAKLGGRAACWCANRAPSP